jgi:RHH-type transcriptional regulator, proline utilization regulon repressor / proline dehydrogenase / delta 1-pyrroline-5-carboxylate dehydrogenase
VSEPSHTAVDGERAAARVGADAAASDGAGAAAGGAGEFANERHLELRRPELREALLAAGRELLGRLPLQVPVLIGERAGRGDGGGGALREGLDASRPGGAGREGLVSVDPGRPSRVVARAAPVSEQDVEAAVELACAGKAEWAARSARERARVLMDAAALLRERRLELAALAVYECGKPWVEADADVCEAIDFLRYYARRGLALGRDDELSQPPGERNSMRYVARGVVGVIAPWNFPFAIPAGMAAGALAAGNAVVLKPAEQSPACAGELVAALREAGVPAPALALLPGEGGAGEALVRHSGVSAIAFTGSAEVGLRIVRLAAETPAEQRHIKRVVAEMGGKNCVIVDSDADLDEAVPAIVRSAFAYAGQKCSAAARVLAHGAVAAHLGERLAGAVQALRVGQADEPGVDLGPLIDADAQRRVSACIQQGASEGRVLAQAPLPQHSTPAERDGAPPAADGFFVRPTLITDLPAGSSLLQEEIFGPVLTIEAVRDLEHACEIVDGLRFGLTGGLFSRNPASVRYVRERTPVGNLYVNREITGAMVARQPFGGNRLSGTGSKAGGPDYLLEFCEARVVCENTTRHGMVV